MKPNKVNSWLHLGGGVTRPTMLLVCLSLGALLGCNACGSSTPEATNPTPEVSASSPDGSSPAASGVGVGRESGGCVVGGCAAELCVEAGKPAEPSFSNCEYKREYDCYKEAQCGRDANNQCNWIASPVLDKCLKRHGVQ